MVNTTSIHATLRKQASESSSKVMMSVVKATRPSIFPPEILCLIATFLPDDDNNIKAQLLCFAGCPYDDIVLAKTEKERCDAIARADAVLLCQVEDPRLKIHYFAPIPALLRSVVQHEAWSILNFMAHQVKNCARLLYWYFAEMGKLELVKWYRPFCGEYDFIKCCCCVPT